MHISLSLLSACTGAFGAMDGNPAEGGSADTPVDSNGTPVGPPRTPRVFATQQRSLVYYVWFTLERSWLFGAQMVNRR